MKLSKTSEHAIRVLVFMAQTPEEQYSVNTLHETLNIPFKYLGRLMPSLAAAGFVVATHGKNGGYKLLLNYEFVTIASIIDVIDAMDSYSQCILGFENCGDGKSCPLHGYWGPHRDAIKKLWETVTLKDLAKRGFKI